MKNALIAILLCGAVVAACEQRSERAAAVQPGSEVETSWALDDADKAGEGGGVNFRADVDSGEVELKLPGGLQGKVTLPEGLGNDTKFDLDGVGRFPGAKLVTVDVNARDDRDGGARVVLGFIAPGSADKVADWYEQALVDKGRSVARTGTTITATTKDGKPMVIAISDGAANTARGRITIVDKNG